MFSSKTFYYQMYISDAGYFLLVTEIYDFVTVFWFIIVIVKQLLGLFLFYKKLKF
jgi:hypothetical protein